MSTSNIRINTYKYSCHCRGEAEGDAQPLKTKRPAKSKADVILDTVTKFLLSHCGKNTEWFYDKEEKWKKKLSDLAQGKGQSTPPEWMPFSDKEKFQEGLQILGLKFLDNLPKESREKGCPKLLPKTGQKPTEIVPTR